MTGILQVASAIGLAMAALLAVGASARADVVTQSTALEWRIESFGADDDGTLRGYRPEGTWTFEVPVGWDADGVGRLILHVRGSPLLADDAAMSIIANDRPLTSVRIRPGLQVTTVVVPTESLRSGLNTFQFQAILPLERDQTCIEPDHPGRWFDFNPLSQFVLRVSPGAQLLSVSEATSAFRPLLAASSERVAIVLPRDPDTDVLDAAATVSQAVLGAQAAGRLELIWADDFDPDDWVGPALLLGPTDTHPFVADMAPSDDEGPWLTIRRPAWSGGRAVLTVGGHDAASVRSAAQALADPMQRLRMTGPVAYVQQRNGAQSETAETPERVTLSGLGYDDRTARGFDEQSLTYAFEMPFAWTPDKGVLDLHLVHAAIVEADVSQLIVALNGRRLAGVWLDAPEASENRVELAMPADLLRPGRNFLRFTFDFGRAMPRCEGTSYTLPWATVRAETALSLPHAEGGGRLDLDDFPYLLSHAHDLRQLQVVLPQDPSARDVSDALQLIGVMSDGAAGTAPRLVTADAVEDLDDERHTILLGTPDRQPHLQRINAGLPAPFDLATGELRSDHLFRTARTLRAVELQLALGSGPDDRRRAPAVNPAVLRPTRSGLIDFGVLQAMRAPSRADRVILTVSGASEAGYRRALAALIHEDFHASLAGQLVLVGGGAGRQRPILITWTAPDLAGVPVVRRVDRVLSGRFAPDSPWPTAILVGLALLGVGAVSVVLLRWWRYRTPSGAEH